MKFITISRDTVGGYIGMTANGWTWHYVPAIEKWLLLGDDDNLYIS